ncbi:MAG: hypothetical protein LBP83_07715 [Dysgonamonadaceae bacterium]|nr:hypothetical protein [Dysgonamonadaceae bacterium]
MTKKQNIEFGIVSTLVLLVIDAICETAVLRKTAIFTLLITALFPVLYTPFSFLWYKLARIFETVLSSLLLAVIFFLLVTPLGFLRRWLSKDTLQIRGFKKGTGSVFVVRNKTFETSDLEYQY